MKNIFVSSRMRPYIGSFLILVLIAVLSGVNGLYQAWSRERNTNSSPFLDTFSVVETQLEIDPDATAPATTAQAYWMYERNTKSVLAAHNAETATAVASLAKLMTAYVSYDTYDLDTVVPVGSASAVEGNRAKFYASDEYRVYDLLQALLIFSANDAAESLAQAYPGGREEFVKAMNQAAQDLGMENTSFENPTGLDGPEQFSSPADLGILADAILQFPTVSQVVSRQVTTIFENNTKRPTVVYSTNALLSRDPRYQGVKTGTTDLAGQSLIVRYVDPTATSAATPRGTDILLVLLGSQERFSDAENLIKWATPALRPQTSALQ